MGDRSSDAVIARGLWWMVRIVLRSPAVRSGTFVVGEVSKGDVR
jgi:hypothetical protein